MWDRQTETKENQRDKKGEMLLFNKVGKGLCFMSRTVMWVVLLENCFFLFFVVFFDNLKVFHEIFRCKVYFVNYIIPVLNWFNMNWSGTIKRRFCEMSYRALSIKISQKTLFTTTYFAVAVSCAELKPTQTFTVMHEKFSPLSYMFLKKWSK